MALSSMFVLRLPTPSLIVHVMPFNGHGTKHVMSGRWMSPSPLLVFVSCLLFARVPFCFVVASNLVCLYDPFLARARVRSCLVVESHLSSPFIVFQTLCGHATSNIFLVVPGHNFLLLNAWSQCCDLGTHGRANSLRTCPQAPATRPQVFASVSKHSRRNHPRISVVAFGLSLLRRV